MQLVDEDMQLAEDDFQFEEIRLASRSFTQIDAFPESPETEQPGDTKLYEMRIDQLRAAIRKNQVTFPAQVPTFTKHDRPDLQQKLAQLYFLCGWNCPKIGDRYSLSRLRVQQILNVWKRRAVEVGYIQAVPPAEKLPRSSEYPPLRAVLSPIVNDTAAPGLQFQVPLSPIDSRQLPEQQIPSYRSRKRFDVEHVVGILQQLEAGRTVTEMTAESGISACTIRAWKQKQERHQLQRENIRLKGELARLGAGQATLMDLITRSDKTEAGAFMPFLRVSLDTEPDYRESL